MAQFAPAPAAISKIEEDPRSACEPAILWLLPIDFPDASADEPYNLFNVANFSNPGAVANGGSIADQRLPDFLVLTSLNGGNGQPRALQFSVRFAF